VTVVERIWRTVGWLAWPVAIVVIQQLLFPAPAGSLLAGVVLGLITSLVSLGMYLVYRSNRVLNFAAGELGLLPAVFAVLLIVESGLSWYLSFGLGLVSAAILGVAAEFLIIRRFFNSPRLVVTVATIGVAQLLGLCALLLPRWWDSIVQSQRIDAPFELEFELGSRVFTADHVLVLVVAPLAILAVGALLRWTRLGIAIRAAAELPTRAGLLGIPVKGLQSVVWSLATVLAFLALFLRSGIYGLPVGGQLGLLLLLRSLAALTLGRMVHLPTILASSIALGVLQEAIVWNSGAVEAEAKMGALTGVVIVVALLARRSRGLRSEVDGSSWQNAGDARPPAPVFARWPPVRIAKAAALVVLVSVLLAIPYIGWFDTTFVIRMGLIFLFAIILLSLGVLTGWAGQL
jgi:branched-chain amino acid transport system permease protein